MNRRRILSTNHTALQDMLSTSEWVSLGHPDKVADYISSFLLDRHLERDPDTRFAVEVQIKNEYVTLGGEVTSKAEFTPDEIAEMVRMAVRQIGYTREYQERWGLENTICADDLVVAQHVTRQSPDIAQGVDRDGWGDQGIFWGMAEDNPLAGYMPADHHLARFVGESVFRSRLGGLDIKTQVAMDGNRVRSLVAAVPQREEDDESRLRAYLASLVPEGTEIILNGTGRYVTHGPIGDCGTTGRKLAVDFYGGNCRLGGGSPWTKDGSKADVALNLYARHRALRYLKGNRLPLVYCAISCCIGRPDITLAFFDAHNEQLDEMQERFGPQEAAGLLRLREPRYAALCRNGLFSRIR